MFPPSTLFETVCPRYEGLGEEGPEGTCRRSFHDGEEIP